VVRYERDWPGELVRLDVKKIGRIGGRVERRIHGDRPVRVRGVGWEYPDVAIDDTTRVAYDGLLADGRAVTAVAFLVRTARWFTAQGVAWMGRVMTDNGSAYVSRVLRAAVQALGARQLRTRPYTPQRNDKPERLIRTLLNE